MSLFVDLKYVNSIAHLLRNFKQKQDYLYNFSCPICGDSKKNKLKARGYLLRWKDGLKFKCHNCGCSMSFGDLLKSLDQDAHKQYLYDSFLESKGNERKVEKKQPFVPPKKEYKPAKPAALIGCPSIASLGPDHPARAYLEARKLPAASLKQLYWTDDFKSLVDKVCPGHEFELKKEGRIVIPFLDGSGNILAIQGRTLNKEGIRYITIKAFKDAPRIYGLNKIGKIWKRIYAVEGPLDSLFLPNCIALAGSDIPRSLPIDRMVIVYDNEPKKKETVEKIEKAIEHGYRVCIWPDTITEKDINDMVLAGYKPDKIRELIDRNSHTGLGAKEALRHWVGRKC